MKLSKDVIMPNGERVTLHLINTPIGDMWLSDKKDWEVQYKRKLAKMDAETKKLWLSGIPNIINIREDQYVFNQNDD